MNCNIFPLEESSLYIARIHMNYFQVNSRYLPDSMNRKTFIAVLRK